MNSDQDCNYSIDTVTYGFPSMSAAFIPRAAARGIWRFFLGVLIVAGLLGATLQALQCSRIIAQVISAGSHPSAIHHANRKDR
jgi:hypothetical protein